MPSHRHGHDAGAIRAAVSQSPNHSIDDGFGQLAAGLFEERACDAAHDQRPPACTGVTRIAAAVSFVTSA